MAPVQMEGRRYRRLWWIALTLPLPLAVLAVYTLFEWLFFVTKPSVLSALSWPDRFTVLVETPIPFIPFVLAAQTVATLIGIIVFKHLRGIAVVPGGLLLGALGLVLIDNFTHVLFGFSSTNIDVRLRYVYAVVLLLLVTTACYWLFGSLDSGSPARKVVVLLLLALPSFLPFAVAEARRPRVGSLFSFVEPRRPPSKRPNVLFLTADSLEARYMSVYGAPKRTTPFLETIRDETLFCENAFSNACRTYGSMTVFLTGKRPTSTHVLDPPSMVYGEARHEHLPGILRKHGYRALQLTMKHYADAADVNLVGAFDMANYDWEMLRLGRVDNATDTARVFRLQVFDRLQDRLTRIFAAKDRDSFAFVIGEKKPPYWSDGRRVKTLIEFMAETDEPWFAHVHMLDTHAGITGEDVDPDVSLRDADEHMRSVFDALRRSGQLDRTIVVISSDHGRKWQTRDRVPLMIRFPRGQQARQEAKNVQTADIAPTTLDALGLPIPSWMDGRSLLRSLPESRPIVALCGMAAQPTGNPEEAAKLRVPNFGTYSAMLVTGSWWYELRIADGVLRTGPVAGHTVPTPQTPPQAARVVLERELSAAGFRLASGGSTESASPTPAAASVR
jgi:hypothetical protein